MKEDKIILGIDPGTNIMGHSTIHLLGREVKLIGAGIISLEKTKDHPLKLKKIFEGTIELIELYKPDEMAIESPFFGKNVQSMLKLGRAQGIAIAAAIVRGIPVFEYSPKKIKQSITGNGNASKEQVAAMLQKLLPVKTIPRHLDATDALGVAMCHYFQSNSLGISDNPPLKRTTNPKASVQKKYSGWKSFLAQNQGKMA